MKKVEEGNIKAVYCVPIMCVYKYLSYVTGTIVLIEGDNRGPNGPSRNLHSNDTYLLSKTFF